MDLAAYLTARQELAGAPDTIAAPTVAQTTVAPAPSGKGLSSAASPPVVTGSEPSGGTSTGGNTNTNSDVLDTAQRQVIYQASVSLSVNAVSTALAQVQTIAQSLGGLVDSMSSNGEQDQQQATVTIRVPGAVLHGSR